MNLGAKWFIIVLFLEEVVPQLEVDVELEVNVEDAIDEEIQGLSPNKDEKAEDDAMKGLYQFV